MIPQSMVPPHPPVNPDWIDYTNPQALLVFAPPLESPASIPKSSSVPPGRKCIRKDPGSKKVQWGSAYSYKSNRSQDDVRCMWYNQQDLEVFQKEKKKIIRALKHVKGDLTALEGTKYVTRGFECYQSINFNRRIRQQRQAVLQNVLKVQGEQRSGPSCTDADEAVAQAARQQSEWARKFALELGAKDAETNEMGWKEFFSSKDEMEQDSSDSEGSNTMQQELLNGDVLDEMHLDKVDTSSVATQTGNQVAATAMKTNDQQS